MYRKQFLLTTRSDFRYHWNSEQIGEFRLFCHPHLSCTCKRGTRADLFLLGELYDWENPRLTNEQILESLAGVKSVGELLSGVSRYSGEYVLISRFDQDIFVFNDACGQAEVYYDDDFSSFGTQPKLLGEVIDLRPHEDPVAGEFYRSGIFKKKALFIGESTHHKNIRHLLPNHFIHVNDKTVSRFFPVIPLPELSPEHVADKASLMLKGYLKAISCRNEIALAVTGGYDSRVLFLASLETDCMYYVLKHTGMTDSHYDISVPRELTSLYHRSFLVIPDPGCNAGDEEYVNSVDFPRFIDFSGADFLTKRVLVNGNVSEVARNYFGDYKNLSGEELSRLNGYQNARFPVAYYGAWLKKNKAFFSELGYHYLDLFYWEEKMGIWGAKAKTEFNSLNKTVTSPFNSRDLLVLLLSVKREYRDSHFNRLYNQLIRELSQGREEVTRIPVNPCRKQKMIRLMKWLNVYQLYRIFVLRLRTLEKFRS
ncbi:MAG: hypothetical protein AB2L20_10085 [Mangrovibacterium sp.]